MFRPSCLFRSLRPPIKECIKRSFRRPANEASEIDSFRLLKLSDLWKPTLFSVGFTGSVFAACSVWQYESYVKSHTFISVKNIKESLNRFNSQPTKRGHYRNEAEKWWMSLSETQKLVYGIGFLNLCVFGAWRVPSLQPFMMKWFTCSATKKPLLPMVLSMFSHKTPVHLGVNMFVLYSFAQPTGIAFGKEQFLALYLTSGIFGSLASMVNKVIVGSAATSVGASAAVFGPLAATCILFPDSQLQIIFLPFFTFSAGIALKGIMALDAVGLIARWTFLDHAAHLGGALFGVYYVMYGQYHFSNYKAAVIRDWHRFRTRPSGG